MKAYSLLTIKTVDEDRREITGIASTPELDHVGDSVLPEGARFKLPIPLLLGHDQSMPIGNVTHAKVTGRGIEVRATIARTSTPGSVKDRLDAAWQDIKLGLVRGLSIGFSPLKSEPLKSGGRRFLEWAWHELSAVVCPANAGAGIEAVKSADRQSLKPRRPGCVYLDEAPGSSRLREAHPGSVYVTKRRKSRVEDPTHRGSVWLR